MRGRGRTTDESAFRERHRPRREKNYEISHKFREFVPVPSRVGGVFRETRARRPRVEGMATTRARVSRWVLAVALAWAWALASDGVPKGAVGGPSHPTPGSPTPTPLPPPWGHARTPLRPANMETSAVIQTGRGIDPPARAGGGSARDGAAHPLWAAGLRGAGQLVGVGDSGLNLESCFLRDPLGRPPGPDHRKVHAYVTAFGDAEDGNGHGTHVVASILGSADATGLELEPHSDREDALATLRAASAFDGMAPDARAVFTDIGVGPGGVLYLPTSMERYYAAAYDAGARVHSDSWGNDVPAYDALAREVDAFAWRHRDFLPIFAAGNFGADARAASTVTSPSTCKNGVSVGASLGWRGANVNVNDPPRRAGDTFEMTVTLDVGTTRLGASIATADGDGDPRPRPRRATLVSARVHLAAMGPSTMPSNDPATGAPFALVEADPPDACGRLSGERYRRAVTLVARGGCLFSTKVRNAQDAGAAAVIVANDREGGFFKIGFRSDGGGGDRGDDGGDDGGAAFGDAFDDSGSGEIGVRIPSASTPLSTGREIRAALDAAGARAFAAGGNRTRDARVSLADLRRARVSFAPARVSPRRVDHIAAFSSFGPTRDGRIKPDLVAPGEIASAAGTGNRTPDRRNDSASVRAACRVVEISGTSMATPIVAGAATLARQYFADGYYPTGRAVPSDGFRPSAALVKAALVNGAQPMRGFAESGLPLEPPPSIRQGHGRVHVGRSLPVARADEDEDEDERRGGVARDRMFAVDDDASSRGEVRAYCVAVARPEAIRTDARGGTTDDRGGDGSYPRPSRVDWDDDEDPPELRATLAWTDPPPALPLPPGASALVNDLDLEIVPLARADPADSDSESGDGDSNTDADPWAGWGEDHSDAPYLTEDGGWSTRDRANNVERVRVRLGRRRDPRRRYDAFLVRVVARDVRWVPPDDPRGQPYALVVTGPGLVTCEAARGAEAGVAGGSGEAGTGAGAGAGPETGGGGGGGGERAREEANPRALPNAPRVPAPAYPKPAPMERGCRWWQTLLDPRCWR